MARQTKRPAARLGAGTDVFKLSPQYSKHAPRRRIDSIRREMSLRAQSMGDQIRGEAI